MKFKMSEDLKEAQYEDNQVSKKFTLIIVIIVSIIVFLIVYLLTNWLIKKNEPAPVVETKKEITDKDVSKLINILEYNRDGQDEYLPTFYIEDTTTSNLTDRELLNFALANVDKSILTKTDKENIYTIKTEELENNLKSFVKTKNDLFKEELNVNLDDEILNVKYDKDKDYYILTYTNKDNNGNNNDDDKIIDDYYYKFISAKEFDNKKLEIYESVIFTTLEKKINDDTTTSYICKIYKDYNHNNLIETKPNMSLDQLKKKNIDISLYESRSATVTYVFEKDENKNYILKSSSIN